MSRTLPAPYQDVALAGGGPPLPLLGIDDADLPAREALIRMVWHLLCATQVGVQAPGVDRIYQRITHPEPGDLVVERSRLRRHLTEPDEAQRAWFQRSGLGILLLTRKEWVTDPENPTVPPDDGDRVAEPVTYLQYGAPVGAVSRWVNSAFLTIPIGGDFSRPAGRAGDRPGQVVLNRVDLLNALADIGLRIPERAP